MSGNTNVTNSAVKVPLTGKIGYSLGEAGSQFSWTLIGSYLTVFYTDVVGLTPLVISTIMLIARIWDAINDPMFGSIAENTKSKHGRFRPWILWGSPFLCLLNCLCFLNLDISPSMKALWCGLTYILCGMAYTAVNISVGCLANSMTSINAERVSLNAFRGVGSSLVGFLISAIAMPLILFFGHGSTSEGRGYFLAAVVFSIIALPCFLMCFASTKEVIGGGARTKGEKNDTLKNLVTSFKITFKDRNAMFMVLAMFCFLTGIFGRLGIMAYFFIYVMGNPMGIASFGMALQIGMMLSNVYAPAVLNRFDKKWVGVVSCFCQAVACTIFFFQGQSHASAVAIAAAGFFYGVTNLGGLVSYGLGAEIIDDNWLKTGVRADGVIYSCISFSTKLGNAVGGSVGILVLGAVGFIANAELSPAVLTKMNAVINFGPVLFFVLSAVFFSMVKMTNAKGKENEALIKEKVAKGEL